MENLNLELSLEKTKITNINKEPANFLGYKIHNRKGEHTVVKFYNKASNS